jgi:hypothetical protein
LEQQGIITIQTDKSGLSIRASVYSDVQLTEVDIRTIKAELMESFLRFQALLQLPNMPSPKINGVTQSAIYLYDTQDALCRAGRCIWGETVDMLSSGKGLLCESYICKEDNKFRSLTHEAIGHGAELFLFGRFFLRGEYAFSKKDSRSIYNMAIVPV